MPRSPVLTATLQSTFLGALSSALAQGITSYRQQAPLSIDWIPVFRFVLFVMISTPPNFLWYGAPGIVPTFFLQLLWQEYLEKAFPSNPGRQIHPKKTDDKQPDPPLSKRNTATKFLLDQSVGAAVNTVLFSIFMRSLRTASGHAPVVTNFTKAIDFWVSPGAVDFSRVDFDEVLSASLDEFWPILSAGYKLWPLVSLVNFSLIKSVQVRNLVGAIAGVAWGVYICLVTTD